MDSGLHAPRPAYKTSLDESRHFFGLWGVQRQVKVCQVIFMCLVRKAVTPLEHNLLLVFIPEENISHKCAFFLKTGFNIQKTTTIVLMLVAT